MNRQWEIAGPRNQFGEKRMEDDELDFLDTTLSRNMANSFNTVLYLAFYISMLLQLMSQRIE